MHANRHDERTRHRDSGLRQMLEARRIEVIGELQSKMRDVRNEGANLPHQGVPDEAETCELDVREDIEFALLQMKAETLEKISEALTRLDQGHYGRCYECGEEIAERRLRALPFAVRCTQCERLRETERERVLQHRYGAPTLYADMYR